MATEGQVTANRTNAQKSTGPRTPEGKEKASQNAVRHGFFAQEVVIKGEDPGEFEFFRDQMLEELAPAGPTESLLATRIVGLSWRLQRAERLQGVAFDTLGEEKKPAKPIWSDEAKGWVVPQPAQLGPEEQARRIVQDFGEARILDRLLVYERRIEYSLYRTMAQLEKHQRQRREGGASNLKCEVSSLKLENPASSPLTSDFTLQASNSPIATSGVHTNVGEADERSCETNPISAAPRSTGILPVNLDHGRDGDPKRDLLRLGTHAHATVPPSGVDTNVAKAEGQSCKTNPISGPGPDRPEGMTVRNEANFVNSQTEVNCCGEKGLWEKSPVLRR